MTDEENMALRLWLKSSCVDLLLATFSMYKAVKKNNNHLQVTWLLKMTPQGLKQLISILL